MTLSVTTERLFSTSKRLKTYITNYISQARLNDITLMNIYRKIKISIDEVINDTNTKARRLNFRLK